METEKRAKEIFHVIQMEKEKYLWVVEKEKYLLWWKKKIIPVTEKEN